jgi:hypothetical protein
MINISIRFNYLPFIFYIREVIYLKRLMKTAKKYHGIKRIAEWNDVDMHGSAATQIITDAMAYDQPLQINYSGSGWRTILPYGWNSSKNGDVLLMCYKNDGEIRSYRMDKIVDLLIEDTLADMISTYDASFDIKQEDFEMPMLPDIDDIIETTESEDGNESPYDEGLAMLSQNNIENGENTNGQTLQPNVQAE